MGSDHYTISFYEGSVPSFIEAEMERLYENIYSSLVHFKAGDSLPKRCGVYVAETGRQVKAVFLVCLEGSTLRILNESIDICSDQIAQFARYIFTTCPNVNIIFFHAIHTTLQRFPYPYQQTNVLEDIVVSLPESVDTYLNRLGKATRKNIKRHLNRFIRHFPSVRCEVYVKESIDDCHIHDIIALNRLRMRSKSKVSGIDQAETDYLIRLMKQRGLVFVMRLDGRICAGGICSQVGTHYYSHVNAHHPYFDEHRLGTLCCYLTICECIKRNGKALHLLWGQYEYKYLLLGMQRNLDDLVIYRSRAQLLLNSGIAVQVAAKGKFRQARNWARKKVQHPEDSPLLNRFITRVRNVKQYATGLLERQK